MLRNRAELHIQTFDDALGTFCCDVSCLLLVVRVHVSVFAESRNVAAYSKRLD